MRRHLKFLLLAATLMVAVVAGPPPGGIPIPTDQRPPLPGKPPSMVEVSDCN